MSVIISTITPDLAPVIWPAISDMIDRAIKHSNGELSLDSVLDKVEGSEMLLLTADEGDTTLAAFILEKNHFPSGKTVLNITITAGDNMEKWFAKSVEVANNIAKKENCDEIYIVGRPGWKKMFSPLGYDEIHTVLSKKVEK